MFAEAWNKLFGRKANQSTVSTLSAPSSPSDQSMGQRLQEFTQEAVDEAQKQFNEDLENLPSLIGEQIFVHLKDSAVLGYNNWLIRWSDLTKMILSGSRPQGYRGFLARPENKARVIKRVLDWLNSQKPIKAEKLDYSDDIRVFW